MLELQHQFFSSVIQVQWNFDQVKYLHIYKIIQGSCQTSSQFWHVSFLSFLSTRIEAHWKRTEMSNKMHKKSSINLTWGLPQVPHTTHSGLPTLVRQYEAYLQATEWKVSNTVPVSTSHEDTPRSYQSQAPNLKLTKHSFQEEHIPLE